MKNYFLIISVCFFFFFSSQAQVGINTLNPLGVFHVDPKGDTSGSDVSNANLFSDDVIISSETGNLGIGTLTPSTKLHVVTDGTSSNPIPGFTLQDGNQSKGRVLTSIDNNGTATWQPFGFSEFVQFDSFESNLNIVVGENVWYTGFSYDFKKYGTYLIMIGARATFSLRTIDDTLLQFRTTLSPNLYDVWFSPTIGRIPGSYEVYGYSYYSNPLDKRYYFLQTITLNESTGTNVYLLMFARNSLPGAVNGNVDFSLGGIDSIRRGGAYVRIN